MFKSFKRNNFRASALAVAISLIPASAALAAGLGKVTVLSPLGQPLRAEVEVSASREELSAMTAKVASPDAFKQAGIDYAPALTGIRLVLDKRASGQPFLRMTSDRPMNEPFLDVLVELTWSSGRVLREYTMLLDPPEALQRPTPVPVAPPEVKAPSKVATKPVAPQPAPVAAPAPSPATEPVAKAPAPAPAPVPKAEGEPGSHTVKRGDTLSKIAGTYKPEGVNLDQMLVALFKGNPDAFDGGNMNRLRSGRILKLPDQAAVEAVAPTEARKIILSQTSDFNAYRQKLAGSVAAAPVAKDEAPKQEATGKITPKVEEAAAAPAPVKDKLEVSRTEAAKEAKALQGRITSLEEDLVARDKALKEASGRIAELEKNLADLKKLAELKSQAGAQLQQQAQAAKPEPVPPAPPPAAAPVEVPKAEQPAEPVVPPAPPAEAAKPVETPAPAPAPVEPPKAVPEVPATPPAPPVEPSFMDENGTLVYGGGAILALLLGWLGYSSMRRKREGDLSPTTSRITEGDLMANSVFGATGGQAVDTGASIQTDFSQSNLTSIDADEGVDPVAEADVYMAYGRDAQAEEILLDALKNDPSRHAIHLKLLEIYSSRKSVKQFESLATDLYGQTGGAGADWEKAAEMGRQLDPGNPLYGNKNAEPAVESAGAAAEENLVVPPSEVEKLRDTVTMPGVLSAMAATATAAAAEPESPTAMDFELDLGTSTDIQAPASAPEVEEGPALDLNLELPSVEGASLDATVPMGMRAPEAAPAPELPGLDFEFDLDAPAEAPAPSPAQAGESAPQVDLSEINLDLGTSTEPYVGASDQDDPDVTTKIELAQAYEEMGDKEGARELLQEVAQEGSARQQEIARNKLALLGA